MMTGCIGFQACAGSSYTADWESLKKHNEAPDWFLDAKFGIYFHWGVYSVPAFGNEWYPRNVYIEGSSEYEHHIETYGPQTEFGYPDFVPMFKAEKFDAEEWAALFERAGARFAGPVAEHHDGFSMWASDQTPWNAEEKGPKRDITGELEEAVRAHGMRFVTTFHHARNNLWKKGDNWTGHYEYVKKDFPSLLEDPENAIMYGYMPRDEFLDMWKGKLLEVIDNYRPDLIWFDSWLDEIPDEYRTSFLAYYFNKAEYWGKDVVVTFKQTDLPRAIGVEDFEKGRADRLTDYAWLTDDTISRGSWCYTRDLTIKPTEEVLHSFIDIVSKNGVLLLNISPKADGTIPENQKRVLLEIGEWLKVCGEAIYNTRPWEVFGEGPTRIGKGGAFIRWSGRYSSKDIRYTRSKDGKTLYAVILGWPEDDVELSAVNIGEAEAEAGARIEMLGYDEPLEFTVNDRDRPVISMPELDETERPCKFAYCLKLTGFDTSVDPMAKVFSGNYTSLTADKATLEGDQIATEEKLDRPNIGFWDDPSERVHWLANIRSPGKYSVLGEFAKPDGSRPMKLQLNDQTLEFRVDGTGGWDRTKMVEIGYVDFSKTGVYHVILSPADKENWSAVNLWRLVLAPMD
ncbi:MAG: alpha-L-fucosidase [Verrucomicrobia bacterium]|nr:alpha-L-fucosidase [Verrucomicrobiota bacterium]MCF7708213.1 alpha-L-fucosidase [Verrucomicrobiota bacterium]